MLEPFADGGTGLELLSGAAFAALVREAAERLAVAVHAIGDRACRAALDAFEQTRDAWQPLGLRQRIEHAQLLHPDDVARFGRLGVIASMQPSHAPSDRDVADAAWGDRAAFAYAWRALADAGAALAFGPTRRSSRWRRSRASTPPSTARSAIVRRGAASRPDGRRGGRRLHPAARPTPRAGDAPRASPGFEADLVDLGDDPFTAVARADRVDRRRGHHGGRPLGARPAAMVDGGLLPAALRARAPRARAGRVGRSFLVSLTR